MDKNILSEIEESGYSLKKLVLSHPELSALEGVPQNPEYHGEGDVLRHTEMVCAELIKLPLWQELPQEHKALLFLAAAFPAIGKPACPQEGGGKRGGGCTPQAGLRRRRA